MRFSIMPVFVPLVLLTLLFLVARGLGGEWPVQSGRRVHPAPAPNTRRMTRVRIAFGMSVAATVAVSVVNALLSRAGLYRGEEFFRLMPGLWMPVIPVALLLLPLLSRDYREAMLAVLDHTPVGWLVYFQAFRIAALGTLLKTIAGDFPVYFEVVVGIPDLTFGLSAPLVAHRLWTGGMGWRALRRWHLSGAAVVGLGAVLVQVGLPGPFQIFSEPPTAERLLEFPMILAPTLIVPLFALTNLWAVWWLTTREPMLEVEAAGAEARA